MEIHIFRNAKDELLIEPPYAFVHRGDTVEWHNHTDEDLLWTFSAAEEVFEPAGNPPRSRANVNARGADPTAHARQVRNNAPKRNYAYSVYSKDRQELAKGSEVGVD